jgi:hypothetical protein
MRNNTVREILDSSRRRSPDAARGGPAAAFVRIDPPAMLLENVPIATD